jgi:hypothetical protein
MRRSARPAAFLLACLLAATALVGCSGGDDDVAPPQPRSTDPNDQGRIVQSGFGQRDQFVWATAVVENEADHGGQTATVKFRVLDADGQVIGTAEESWTFSWTAQQLAIGAQVTLDVGQEAASVEPTLTVTDDNPRPVSPPLGAAQSQPVKNDSGGYTASFTVTNPTDLLLQAPMVGVVCYTAAGDISGGGVTYAPTIDPGTSVEVEPSVIVSPDTSVCTAYTAP